MNFIRVFQPDVVQNLFLSLSTQSTRRRDGIVDVVKRQLWSAEYVFIDSIFHLEIVIVVVGTDWYFHACCHAGILSHR
jgi:hypothetical protein